MELENDVEKYLVRLVEKSGGLCYKFVSPNRRGVPDRIVLYKGRSFFVELKRRAGRLAALQKVEARRIEGQGVQVFVVYSKEDVAKLMLKLGMYHAS